MELKLLQSAAAYLHWRLICWQRGRLHWGWAGRQRSGVLWGCRRRRRRRCQGWLSLHFRNMLWWDTMEYTIATTTILCTTAPYLDGWFRGRWGRWRLWGCQRRQRCREGSGLYIQFGMGWEWVSQIFIRWKMLLYCITLARFCILPFWKAHQLAPALASLMVHSKVVGKETE